MVDFQRGAHCAWRISDFEKAWEMEMSLDIFPSTRIYSKSFHQKDYLRVRQHSPQFSINFIIIYLNDMPAGNCAATFSILSLLPSKGETWSTLIVLEGSDYPDLNHRSSRSALWASPNPSSIDTRINDGLLRT